MGIKERQQRERTSVRDAILDAARALFVSEGYSNVTMRRIAERIEYSPGAIYSYFPSKDDIFLALADEGFHLLAEFGMRAHQGTADPLERLRRMLWALYEFSKMHPEYFELMFIERSVPSLTEDFQRFGFFQQTTAAAQADIRACIERGQFSARLDPPAALHVLWVAIHGAAAVRLAQRLAPGEDADALAHDVIDAVLAGFTTADIRTTFAAAECAFIDPQEPRVTPAPVDRPGDAP